jgi:hypothetical protein
VAASAETCSAFRRSKGATTRSGAVASHSVYLARASHVRERDLAHAHTQRVESALTQRVESALADTWRKRSAFIGRVGRVSVCTFLATRGCLQTTKGSSGCAGVDGVTSLNCDRRCPTQSGVSAPDATDEVADGVCFHFYLKPNEWGQQGATISGVAL